MRITIIQGDGVVGVDGLFLRVDLSGLDPAIHAIQFDTDRGLGSIEYDPGATRPIEVRDVAAEDAAWAAARAAGTPEHKIDVPVMKKIEHVPRAPERIEDFAPYQVFVDRWIAARDTLTAKQGGF